MMVIMRTIEHEKQRYPTVGDWFFDSMGNLHIRVSELPSKEMILSVMLHEFVEAILCRDRNIDEKEVTAFDIEFEEQRPAGCTLEPGDDPDAPYFNEHQFATSIEMQFAQQLKLDWGAYEEAVNSL